MPLLTGTLRANLTEVCVCRHFFTHRRGNNMNEPERYLHLRMSEALPREATVRTAWIDDHARRRLVDLLERLILVRVAAMIAAPKGHRLRRA